MAGDLKGKHKAFSSSEIVVAYKHTMRVRRALEERGVAYGKVKCDLDLGLCLVPLEDEIDAAEKFQHWDPKFDGGEVESAKATKTDAVRSSAPLDSFLRGLRGFFAEKYAGWKPLVGKNRLVGYVTGAPGKVTHGGGTPLSQGDAHVKRRTGNKGAGVVVGVLDTSVASHDWLAGGWSCAVDEVFEPILDEDEAAELFKKGNLPNAVAGHATFVAGLILQEAPGCLVRVHQVLSTDGEANSWQVAKEIVRLAKTRPDVINLSLVCYTEDGEAPLALATAIDRIHPDTVVVAAAGNHGDVGLEQLEISSEDLEELRAELGQGANAEVELTEQQLREKLRDRERMKPTWPAAMERVIAIGSGLREGAPSDFTPKKVGWIDALADGESRPSTFPEGAYSVIRDVEGKPGQTYREIVPFTSGFAFWGGTSFAAARVSGAIAARTVPGTKSARQVLLDFVPPVPGDADTTSADNGDQPPFIRL
jgi:subtilisin family serine protease